MHSSECCPYVVLLKVKIVLIIKCNVTNASFLGDGKEKRKEKYGEEKGKEECKAHPENQTLNCAMN